GGRTGEMDESGIDAPAVDSSWRTSLLSLRSAFGTHSIRRRKRSDGDDSSRSGDGARRAKEVDRIAKRALFAIWGAAVPCLRQVNCALTKPILRGGCGRVRREWRGTPEAGWR